ncbi:MAG: hypothetical protein M1453_15350 [Acidobacteria bacterium]|nr:hypothetical protein [Acidobacteriota bacterium]
MMDLLSWRNWRRARADARPRYDAAGETNLLNQRVPAAYECIDAVSEVVACTGTFANAAYFDTASVGAKLLKRI